MQNDEPLFPTLADMDAPRGQGFTLLELLIVITILGIVALAAIPNFISQQGKKLDLAAEEISTALRYAKSEALRSGQPHGARISSADNRLRVFRLDLSAPPIDPTDELTIRYPHDKKPYDFIIGSNPFSKGVAIATSNFSYSGDPASYESVIFDSRDGTPVLIMADGSAEVLSQGVITISLGGDAKAIHIDGATGRVTLP